MEKKQENHMEHDTETGIIRACNVDEKMLHYFKDPMH